MGLAFVIPMPPAMLVVFPIINHRPLQGGCILSSSSVSLITCSPYQAAATSVVGSRRGFIDISRELLMSLTSFAADTPHNLSQGPH